MPSAEIFIQDAESVIILLHLKDTCDAPVQYICE